MFKRDGDINSFEFSKNTKNSSCYLTYMYAVCSTVCVLDSEHRPLWSSNIC